MHGHFGSSLPLLPPLSPSSPPLSPFPSPLSSSLPCSPFFIFPPLFFSPHPLFPYALALDERGRLLVAEAGRADTLRVVDASLAPPAWMGPVDAAAEAAVEAQEELSKSSSCWGTTASWWRTATAGVVYWYSIQ
jgi:hypothetical protein